MRRVGFLALTFLAGQHGFLLFAAYLAFVGTAVGAVRVIRPMKQAADDPATLPA